MPYQIPLKWLALWQEQQGNPAYAEVVALLTAAGCTLIKKGQEPDAVLILHSSSKQSWVELLVVFRG